jgi:hypothetical protein
VVLLRACACMFFKTKEKVIDYFPKSSLVYCPSL